MIESVVFTSKTHTAVLLSKDIKDHKLVFDDAVFRTKGLQSFDITITFQSKITAFRNHDYTWVPINTDRIAGAFAPKAVQLENGYFVQPSMNWGYWEIHRKKPKVLLWRFNPEFSNPLTVYTGPRSERILAAANNSFEWKGGFSLLFSNKNIVEFSRSALPFLPIACFTDHCDFDTLESLKLQRVFFKENNIKVTKGFFLNHFSKREDNASMENDKEEYGKWQDDGHELAYHSLSQSLKEEKESFADFYNFVPPFDNNPTWIDHGYQPYNFSLYQNKSLNESAFSQNLQQKGISRLWNYIDSGTASLGVINQLNTNDFTLQSFSKGIKNLGFKDKAGVLIKNIMFHYYADEKMILKYKGLAGSFKKVLQHKKVTLFFSFIANVFSLLLPLLKVFVFWGHHKKQPYKLAKYTPLIFRHRLAGNDFYVFQTLEMVDFRASLAPANIDKLIQENGVFMAHTYFSVPMDYHRGRIFKNPQTIDETVAANFKYLSSKITNREIWNPTLTELVEYLSKFEDAILDINREGAIEIANAAGLHNRTVN